MSLCRLCGKVVLFRDAHTKCEEYYAESRDILRRLIYDAILSNKDLDLTRQQAQHLIRARSIDQDEYQKVLAESWDAALDYCLSDDKFTPDEMHRMQRACFQLEVSTALLQQMGLPQKIEAFKRRMAEAQRTNTQSPRTKPASSQQTSSRSKPPRAKKSPSLSKEYEWDQWLDEEAKWKRNAKSGNFPPHSSA